MNKEEAIKILKEYAPRIKPFYEPQRTEYPQAIDMAIEALSANVVEVTDKSMESLIKGLEILGDTKDSADESEWIPVSERLPSNNDCVLVTIDDGIEFGKYEDGSWSIWVCEHWDEWDANGTIAWMPLPKPYREDGEA